MRKVWRGIADMNPLKSDNKLVTYSWFACPLLNLQADSRTRLRNGGAPLMPPRYLHLDLPKHLMRNVSRFACKHILLQWNPPSGAVEMATVTSVPVLLFKWGACSLSLSRLVCVLSQKKSTRSFSSLPANFYLCRPLLFYMPNRMSDIRGDEPSQYDFNEVHIPVKVCNASISC